MKAFSGCKKRWCFKADQWTDTETLRLCLTYLPSVM